jgi:hypothetical protein
MIRQTAELTQITPTDRKLITMKTHHPYHVAHRNLRTSKTPVVLRPKRRKWALSLSPGRLSSILLLCFLLLAAPSVITAQTQQPSPFAITLSAENASTMARDKLQPNLSIARVPDHAAAGGSSFIKRAFRGVLRFLFSRFGEGGSSVSKVEPKSKDQDEVTIRSDATVYPPGFDRSEGSAERPIVAVPVADNETARVGTTTADLSETKSVAALSADATPVDWVRVKFEVDGKERLQSYKIFIYVNNQMLVPTLVDGGFIVPPELKTPEFDKHIELHFMSGDYELVLKDLNKDNFDSEWLLGVTNPPFKEQPDLPLVKDGKKLRLIYYVEFHPRNAEGTGWVKRVYK